MKFLMTCFFIGLFISCAHAPNETNAKQDQAKEKPNQKIKNTKTEPSNGGLDL